MDKTKNNTPLIIAAVVVIAAIATFLLFDFRLNDKGELPQIRADVDVEGGKLPQGEVRGPQVSVGSKTAEVTVPKVEVKKETVEVPVPTVNVDLPEDTKGAEASQ